MVSFFFLLSENFLSGSGDTTDDYPEGYFSGSGDYHHADDVDVTGSTTSSGTTPRPSAVGKTVIETGTRRRGFIIGSYVNTEWGGGGVGGGLGVG